MKKNILLAAALTLATASTSALAADIKPFIGLDYSKASVDSKSSISLTGGTVTYAGTTYTSGDSLSYTTETNSNTGTLKIGAVINTLHRVSLRHAGFSENGYDIDITTLNYDYMLPKISSATPYVGVHAGTADLDVGSLSSSSTPIGLQAGAIIPLQSGFEFDVSIAYTKLDLSESISIENASGSSSGVTLNNADATFKDEIEDALIINLGVNYNF